MCNVSNKKKKTCILSSKGFAHFWNSDTKLRFILVNSCVEAQKIRNNNETNQLKTKKDRCLPTTFLFPLFGTPRHFLLNDTIYITQTFFFFLISIETKKSLQSLYPLVISPTEQRVTSYFVTPVTYNTTVGKSVWKKNRTIVYIKYPPVIMVANIFFSFVVSWCRCV